MNRCIPLTRLTALLLLIFIASPSWGAAQNPDPRIKTKKEVALEGKTGVPQMSVESLKEKMDLNKKYLLLDVRTERERNAGYISGSVWVPRGVLEFKAQTICPDADTEIIVYCRKGGRSNLSVKALTALGYTHVVNLAGGVNAWGEKGYSLYNWHGEIKVVGFDRQDPRLASFDLFKK